MPSAPASVAASTASRISSSLPRCCVVGSGVSALATALGCSRVAPSTTLIRRSAPHCPEPVVQSQQENDTQLLLWRNGARALSMLLADGNSELNWKHASNLIGAMKEIRQLKVLDAAGSAIVDQELRLAVNDWPGLVSVSRAHVVSTLERSISERVQIVEGDYHGHVDVEDVSVRTVLSDGNEVESDVLLGADGINSKVRSDLLALLDTGDQKIKEENPRYPLQYFEATSYQFLIEPSKTELAAIESSLIVAFGSATACGLDQPFVVTAYPSHCGRVSISVAAREREDGTAPHLVSSTPSDFIRALAADVPSSLSSLLDKAPDGITAANVDGLELLSAWGHGCISLVGDAAHGGSLYMPGGGVSAALQDAAEVAYQLGRCNPIPGAGSAALRCYEAVRSDIMQPYQKVSRRAFNWSTSPVWITRFFRDWLLKSGRPRGFFDLVTKSEQLRGLTALR